MVCDKLESVNVSTNRNFNVYVHLRHALPAGFLRRYECNVCRCRFWGKSGRSTSQLAREEEGVMRSKYQSTDLFFRRGPCFPSFPSIPSCVCFPPLLKQITGVYILYKCSLRSWWYYILYHLLYTCYVHLTTFVMILQSWSVALYILRFGTFLPPFQARLLESVPRLWCQWQPCHAKAMVRCGSSVPAARQSSRSSSKGARWIRTSNGRYMKIYRYNMI